jgi:hypothetical protein
MHDLGINLAITRAPNYVHGSTTRANKWLELSDPARGVAALPRPSQPTLRYLLTRRQRISPPRLELECCRHHRTAAASPPTCTTWLRHHLARKKGETLSESGPARRESHCCGAAIPQTNPAVFFLKSLQLLSLSFLGWNSNVCKQEESIIWAKRPDSAAKWTRRSPLSVWTSPTAAISAIGPSHVQTNHAAHRCVCCSYKRLPSRG